MDDSISKALIMIVGVLLAVIVIGFITFSFNEIGTWAETSDDERLVKQKNEFNKEYEVYDKDLMYGVDVISCLNKAFSNNEAIKGAYAEEKDSLYEVQVTINLKNNTLTEMIEVYYLPENVASFLEKSQHMHSNGTGVSSITLEEAGFRFLKNDKYMDISGFRETTKLITNTNQKIELSDKTLILTAASVETDDIVRLISCANAVSEVVKNPDPDSYNEWTKAEFKSALYDLKTRKFKCTGLQYSEQGRVEAIEFKEI